MAWRKYGQPKKMRNDPEKQKRLAEENRCPQCQRKSALKFYDLSKIAGYPKTCRKCRWCGYVKS